MCSFWTNLKLTPVRGIGFRKSWDQLDNETDSCSLLKKSPEEANYLKRDLGFENCRKPRHDLTDKVESQLRLTQDIAKSKSSVVLLFTLLRTNWFPFFPEIIMDLFHITSSKFRIWKEATIYITEIKLFFDFFN